MQRAIRWETERAIISWLRGPETDLVGGDGDCACGRGNPPQRQGHRHATSKEGATKETWGGGASTTPGEQVHTGEMLSRAGGTCYQGLG